MLQRLHHCCAAVLLTDAVLVRPQEPLGRAQDAKQSVASRQPVQHFTHRHRPPPACLILYQRYQRRRREQRAHRWRHAVVQLQHELDGEGQRGDAVRVCGQHDQHVGASPGRARRGSSVAGSHLVSHPAETLPRSQARPQGTGVAHRGSWGAGLAAAGARSRDACLPSSSWTTGIAAPARGGLLGNGRLLSEQCALAVHRLSSRFRPCCHNRSAVDQDMLTLPRRWRHRALSRHRGVLLTL